MSADLTGWGLAGAAVGLLLPCWALWNAWGAWWRNRNPVDMALGVAGLIWAGYLLADIAVISTGSTPKEGFVSYLVLQLLIISVSFFLLSVAGLAGTGIYLVLGAQAVAGSAALYWDDWGGGAQDHTHQAWIALNLLAAILLTLAVALRVQRTRSYPCWLALAGSIIGLGVSVDASDIATLSHHAYAAFLLVIWHLVTHRVGRPDLPPVQTSDLSRISEFDSITGFGHDQDVAASAVATERRRIAQDLHDGVGAQIVNILSSLDSHAPQQQAVALALEQCLVDLKMTVDAIDSANDNVLEALGQLRYRVQHSLDKMGIRMIWRVEICDELEAVRGVQAQQVLRIAQECLSNVMRHARATAVEVVCRFVPEPGRLVLEVYDNGQGIDRSQRYRSTGKGLEGMRRRAQSVGGELLISSKNAAGTRVRFTLLLAANPEAH